MTLVTWDAINKGVNVVLSNGNLTTEISSNTTTARTTIGRESGKWYWEINIVSGGYFLIGIINKDAGLDSRTFDTLNSRYYYSQNGNRYYPTSTYGATYTVGDVIGVALDLDNGKLEFYKNGISQGIAFSDIKTMGKVFPSITSGGAIGKATANFGATPFKYNIPQGFRLYEGFNKILISSSNGEALSIKKGGYTDNLIPVMTSNNSPSGIASASNELSGNEAWKAFNGNKTDVWIEGKYLKTGFISYTFPVGKKIKKYSIFPVQNPATWSPTDWILRGSNDGINWTDLDVRSNVTTGWVYGSPNEFIVDYKYNNSFTSYKLDVSDVKGGTYLRIAEIEMYESISSKLTTISSQSEQSFINHGMDKPLELDVTSEIGTIAFIEQSPTTLGSGKVFKKSIDISQVPIKKVAIK